MIAIQIRIRYLFMTKHEWVAMILALKTPYQLYPLSQFGENAICGIALWKRYLGCAAGLTRRLYHSDTARLSTELGLIFWRITFLVIRVLFEMSSHRVLGK